MVAGFPAAGARCLAGTTELRGVSTSCTAPTPAPRLNVLSTVAGT